MSQTDKLMSQTDKLLAGISEKLDKMLRLLAVDVVRRFASEQKKIELLDSLGFNSTEIAKFLNKSSANVDVQLDRIQKKKGKVTKLQSNKKVNATEKSVEDM